MDLPAVHFMCNHSYHQRYIHVPLCHLHVKILMTNSCLSDSESECPICARSNGVISEIRRNNAKLAEQHELFFNEVKERGLEGIAAGFGRGWLNRKLPPDSS